MATQFRDLASGDAMDGNVLGDFTGAVTDTIELYQPDTSLNLGSPISTLTVSVDPSTFDTITFARGDSVVMDEFRFGATYDAVIGVSP